MYLSYEDAVFCCSYNTTVRNSTPVTECVAASLNPCVAVHAQTHHLKHVVHVEGPILDHEFKHL